MRSSGLFQAPPVKPYYEELYAVIDKYVAANKDKWFHGAGVHRARKLRDFILCQLLWLEQLDNEQIMWRMYAHIGLHKESSIGLLESSTNLRMAIARHLCAYLKITQDELHVAIENEWRMVVDAVQGCAAASGGMYLAFNKELVLLRAMLSLIREKLEQPDIVARKAANWSNSYLESLLTSIETYQQAASKLWFKQEGIDRADQLKKLAADQWVRIEGLNDDQLLARMLECVMMPSGQMQGPLGTSKHLRAEIMNGMCEYLQLDLAAINKEIAAACLPTVTTALISKSNFGPTVYLPNADDVSLRIKAEHITAALHRKLRPDLVSNVDRHEADMNDYPHFMIM